MNLYTSIYLLSAILPAVILLKLIYQQDRLEKEPRNLIMKLLGGGILAAFVAVFLENFFGGILSQMSFRSVLGATIANCIMIGLSEEGAKLFFLKRFTWNNHNFNYRFDGIVYSVAVSLGFAAFENVLYVFQYGLGVAVSRALLAVPAHTAFAVFMGSFYGWAKYMDVYGQNAKSRSLIWSGYLVASALHAFYDTCAMTNSDTSMIIFSIFVIVMYIVVIKRVKRESKTDFEF